MTSSSRSPSSSDASDKENVDKVSVFVRVRPLTPWEKLDPNVSPLEGLKLDSENNIDGNDANVAYETSTIRIGGFTGILGQEASNRTVFQRCFDQRLDAVLRGGTASLFCYGYTGGGKTHTCIGYGEEKGLFFLAAERLFANLEDIIAGNEEQVNGRQEEKLFLRATACEIYLDQVYDLIGPEKRPCRIRIDGDGQLVVHGEIQSQQLQGVSDDCRNGFHSTLVTSAPGLCSIPIHQPEDLEELGKTCITQRACGTSTANHTSSRSHAVLRLEVVSTAVNQAHDTLQQLQAELPALKNARDNCRVIREKREIGGRIQSTEKEIVKAKHELNKLRSQGPPALGGSMLFVDLAGADYDHRGGKVQEESTAINQSLLALKECLRSIATTTNNHNLSSSTTQQKKNHQQSSRPPFRRSKLTRILEDALTPRATSLRRNKESTCVMLVNVSPACNLKHGTINALRYGQLFASGGGARSTATKQQSNSSESGCSTTATNLSSISEGRISKLRRQAQERLNNQQNDPDVDPEIWKEEIRKIYASYVPEKTSEQVEDILNKFAGREQGLLERVKAKYFVVPMANHN